MPRSSSTSASVQLMVSAASESFLAFFGGGMLLMSVEDEQTGKVLGNRSHTGFSWIYR